MPALRLRLAAWDLGCGAADPVRDEAARAAFAAVNADFAGVQGVRFGEARQDDALAGSLPGRHYRQFARERAGGACGSAILAGMGEVLAHEGANLGGGGEAHRVLAALPEALAIWFVNAHLEAGGHASIAQQAAALAAWIGEAPLADAVALAVAWPAGVERGDLEVLGEAGLRPVLAPAEHTRAMTWTGGAMRVAEAAVVEGGRHPGLDPVTMTVVTLDGHSRP